VTAIESRWRGEELLNSLTHGLGLALSIAGAAVLIVLAALRGDALHITTCAVYGGTLITLYSASTLYHSFRGPRVRKVFQVIDHCSIFLLIAGTYTPFTLVNLRGAWGWSLFAAVWGIAVLGIVFKAFFTGRMTALSTAAYIAMGWMALLAIKPMLALIPTGGILWIAAGGVAYTLGVVFFACHRIPYNHAIWHLFVIAGSACHYVAVVRYVVPAA
jgi:hemolysin III